MSKVSFVVLTDHEERTISRRLWELRHQRLERGVVHAVEIVVVDAQSSDRTLLLSVPFADALAVSVADRVAQEDLGRRIADGDVVVIVDAATEVTPWLAEEAAVAAANRREALAQVVDQLADATLDHHLALA